MLDQKVIPGSQTTTRDRRTYNLWLTAQREWDALTVTIPGWDQLTPGEQRRHWHEHVDTLYPGVADDAVPIACSRCHDGKFLHTPGARVLDYYPDIVPCPYCSQWTDGERSRRLEFAGIPRVRQIETLSNFHDAPGVIQAFEAASALGEGQSGWKMLLLYGGHGNGKTHLGRGALMAASQRGLPGRYWTVRNLMSVLHIAMDAPGKSADAIIEAAKKIAFLVLDELGTEDKKSGWQAGVLEDLINYRYDNELETIIISNLDITELPAAIVSRLRDRAVCRCVLNEAGDYRSKTQ